MFSPVVLISRENSRPKQTDKWLKPRFPRCQNYFPIVSGSDPKPENCVGVRRMNPAFRWQHQEAPAPAVMGQFEL